MVFFFEKTDAACFLLPILLLLACSSYYANDEHPKIRPENRKLISIFEAVEKLWRSGKGLVDNAVDSSSQVTKPHYEPSNVPNSDRLPRVYEGICNGLKKLATQAVKNTGVRTAGKYYGENGRKGFRVGWNAGKVYLKLEKKYCREYDGDFSNNSATCGDCVVATGEISCPVNCQVIPAQFSDALFPMMTIWEKMCALPRTGCY